jgi:hypothetical protein
MQPNITSYFGIYMMFKRALNVQMSHPISPAEKAAADKASLTFDVAIRELNKAIDHLQIMLTSFGDNPDIPESEILEFRTALRRYRDKLLENFSSFKTAAFKCVVALKPFGTDTETTKITKSFIALVDELEDNVNKFADLFSNLKDKAFVQSIVSTLTNIEKKSEEIKEFIEDRAKSHIQKEILGRTWIDSIMEDLDVKMDQPLPKLLELEEERKKQLSDLGKNQPIVNWQA